jgi:DNA-binding LacI/PurR family transcriptional regulator
MKTHNPTIYDVAKAANVSISTVSRVLNSPHQVSEATREKVIQAIEELQFVPKAEASARARKRFGRIGVLTPYLTAPSFVERINGIAHALHSTEYELIVYSVRNTEQLQHYLDMFAASRRIDGLIILSLPVHAEALRRVVANAIQVVSIEVPNPLCCNIAVDNVLGGQLAARHLLEKGHRLCAYMGEDIEPMNDTGNCEKRLRGFREELQKRGISLPDEYIRLFPLTIEDVVEQTYALLDLPTPPTAIFTYADMYAIGVLKAARLRKLHVPEDLAVIGFDNIHAADFMELTTIDQNLEESGRLAVDILLSQLSGNSRPIQNIEMQIHLKERSTT